MRVAWRIGAGSRGGVRLRSWAAAGRALRAGELGQLRAVPVFNPRQRAHAASVAHSLRLPPVPQLRQRHAHRRALAAEEPATRTAVVSAVECAEGHSASRGLANSTRMVSLPMLGHLPWARPAWARTRWPAQGSGRGRRGDERRGRERGCRWRRLCGHAHCPRASCVRALCPRSLRATAGNGRLVGLRSLCRHVVSIHGELKRCWGSNNNKRSSGRMCLRGLTQLRQLSLELRTPGICRCRRRRRLSCRGLQHLPHLPSWRPLRCRCLCLRRCLGCL